MGKKPRGPVKGGQLALNQSKEIVCLQNVTMKILFRNELDRFTFMYRSRTKLSALEALYFCIFHLSAVSPIILSLQAKFISVQYFTFSLKSMIFMVPNSLRFKVMIFYYYKKQKWAAPAYSLLCVQQFTQITGG